MKNKGLNLDTGAYTKHIFDDVADKDQMTQMQYFDINTWLPYDILHKADRMSMCNALEVRTPLVDKQVASFAATMPIKTRIRGKETKISLRTAAAQELPASVANKEKLGFPSPLASWMKEEKYLQRIKEAFTSDVAAKFFDTQELLKVLDQHVNGVSTMQKVFTLYTFILWYQVYFPEDTKADTATKIRYYQKAQ